MKTMVEWLKSWTNNGSYAIIFFPFLIIILLYFSLKLVRYAEVIIAKSKFGGGFVGGVLIAATTSTPELITEITQSSYGTPSNGIGDDIGSNAFSIFLIGVAGFVSFRFLFLNKLSKFTKITIILSFFATVLMSILLYFNKDINSSYIGLIPVSFFLFYIFTIWLTYKIDRDQENDNIPKHVKNYSLKQGLVWFVLSSVGVVVFSLLVNINVNAFQEGLSIPKESAGGVFLAITTSLPEVVAFFIFLSKRQPTAAIGSLVGSHFFNLGISFFGDLAYTKGPSFANHEMKMHWPLAALTASMLGVLIIHFILAKKFNNFFKKRVVYLTSSSLIVIGYIVGWILILTIA